MHALADSGVAERSGSGSTSVEYPVSMSRSLRMTGRKRIIGARRACEQTSVFQLLGEIRERKHQHTMIHAHHHSVSTQVIVVLNFKI